MSSQLGDFHKWDIVYPLRYPESILCTSCSRYFSISHSQACSHCKVANNVSNIIVKVRPMILWIDKSAWYKSMCFGIPLSTTQYYSDKYNHGILIDDCIFENPNFSKPHRAVISQATRADGNAFQSTSRIGCINNRMVQDEIEKKLLEWVFGY